MQSQEAFIVPMSWGQSRRRSGHEHTLSEAHIQFEQDSFQRQQLGCLLLVGQFNLRTDWLALGGCGGPSKGGPVCCQVAPLTVNPCFFLELCSLTLLGREGPLGEGVRGKFLS